MKKLSLIFVLLFFILPSPFAASQPGESRNQMVGDWINEGNKEDIAETNTDDSSVINHNSEMVSEQHTPNVTIWEFAKMIFALLFVLLLLYGVLRFINKRNKWFDNGRSVENIGGTSLGNNKSLQLVKVGNSILVVGVGDSINLIKEITDEKEAELLLQSYKERTETTAFSTETITDLMKKLPINNKSTKPRQFSSVLKQQMSQLSDDRKKKIQELDDKEGFK